MRHRLDTRILDRVRRPERNGTNIVYIDPGTTWSPWSAESTNVNRG
jgi:hypothetical protein